MSNKTFEEKQEILATEFASCHDSESRYEKIMALGKSLPPMEEALRTEATLVRGCQSRTYLRAWLHDGVMHFEGYSDALISAGLLALLMRVYEGEKAEVVATMPPKYLEALGVAGSLSPGRANGLASIYLRMRQESIRLLSQK